MVCSHTQEEMEAQSRGGTCQAHTEVNLETVGQGARLFSSTVAIVCWVPAVHYALYE